MPGRIRIRCRAGLEYGAGGNHGILADDDDAAGGIELVPVLSVLVDLAANTNPAIVSDAGVLVDDGVGNLAVPPDSQMGKPPLQRQPPLLLAFIAVSPHADDTVQLRAALDDGPHTDDGVVDHRIGDDAPLSGKRAVHLRPVQLGGRQVPGMGVDGLVLVVKIELGIDAGQVQVRLVEAADGSDVLPIAVVDVGLDLARLDGHGDDLLAKVGGVIIQNSAHGLGVEDVDSHGGQVVLALRQALPRVLRNPPLADVQVRGGLLHKGRDAMLPVNPHDAEAGCILPVHAGGGDGDVGPGCDVTVQKGLEVHAVQLVSGEDDVVGGILGLEVDEILAHRIGSPLVPTGVLQRLLRGQNLHESVGKAVEIIGLRDVHVQRRRVELGQDVNLAEA